MKAIKRWLVCVVMLALTASTLPARAEPPVPAVGVSFQFFYDNLSPYGSWVSYPSYGYVWIPRAAPGFRPYFSSGHWVHTYDGWMWVSLYDWGWAPFHYGSWMYDPFYGWLWVPGYHWAPAWVTWGYYSGYYGWAPLSPGISFSYTYYPPIDHWVFVQPRYMTVTGWNNTYYTSYNNRIAFDNNTAISNVRSINVVENAGTYQGQRFNAGPSVAQYERAANTKVNTVAVRDNNTATRTKLSGDNVSIYRPRVDASDRAAAKPSKVTPLESMKRSDAQRINNDADRTKNRIVESKEIEEGVKSREAIKKTVPEIQKERTAPVQREQRKQEINRPAEQPKRNESVQPRTKERQPEARPKSNVESPAPQRKVEPRQQYKERPKQAPVEKMERQQPQPQVAPERKQQTDRVPREPRYQPQPQPQPQPREKGGPHNPK